MQSISVLDCTLRDGGYVNGWKFGYNNIVTILEKLNNANIDIIECGFLTDLVANEDESLFNSVEEIKKILPVINRKSMFVAMIAIGEKEMDINNLSPWSENSIDGIRLTFHKNEVDMAVEWAKKIRQKGYKVFMQPVGVISYTDLEVLQLVEKMNLLNPYAFYIVDTLGSMYRNELFHLFYMIDKSLNHNIKIGFHAHNNLQLAFSNAQELSRIHTKRTLILDASVFGMGRGAGNLPLELIAQYINQNIEQKYDVATILDIYDSHISSIREKYSWGYDVAYDIAAANICHPNYASFFMNKQTLTMKDIENIMTSIPANERAIYNKRIAEEMYLNYQNNKIDDREAVYQIKELIVDKKILVLAPGKTLKTQYNQIVQFIEKENPFVISVNFVDNEFLIDCCFVSNHKRIETIKKQLAKGTKFELIATSNIKDKVNEATIIDYYSYTNRDEVVSDNVGLMLLNLLIKCGVEKVVLAGFDGFKTRYDENYYQDELALSVEDSMIDEKSQRIKKQLQDMKKQLDIQFLTKSIYEE